MEAPLKSDPLHYKLIWILVNIVAFIWLYMYVPLMRPFSAVASWRKKRKNKITLQKAGVYHLVNDLVDKD